VALLVLETGAGLVNSNSYVDLAYADEYFIGHPFHADAWAEITDEDRREALLISASSFLDAYFDWQGYRATTTQAMDWPRTMVYDADGLLLPYYSVPEQIRKATCEQAYILSKGDPAAPLPGVGITNLRIDVIELTFDKAVRVSPISSMVVALLRGLGEYTFSRRIRKVIVG
jgi:hypothetical protein